MKIDFTKFDRLKELEVEFITQIKDQEPHLLGDIVVSMKQLDELSSLIHYVFRVKHHQALKAKYSLTTSIFLVWCSIYDYKEGLFWEPVFSRLKIRYNTKVAEFLGETFLIALKKFGLQMISTNGKTKKFMTPILMHGYIGDYYAGKLLDYLNAVYTSYLKCDVSDQAMESLWADLFNLENEQISIKGEIETLEEKERNIKTKIQQFLISPNLRDMSGSVLMALESNAYHLKEKIQDFSEKLRGLDEEILRYLSVEKELNECQLAFENIKQNGLLSWMDDNRQHLIQLKPEIDDLVHKKLEYFHVQKQNESKEKMYFESQYNIDIEKIKAIKTSILTLGKGREEDGWSILNDFQEHKNKLKNVQAQLKQKRSLYQVEEQFQNISIKQILTTSLTHLAAENPSHFQSFIQTTLRMMDSLLRKQQADEAHRMYQPICQWIIRLAREKKEQRESSKNGSEKDPPVRLHPNGRLVRPRLRQPSLVYDSTERNLFVKVPEQELIVPENFRQIPCFDLVYSDGQEEIDIAYLYEENKLVTQERKVSINRADVKHLAFSCFNISEYWPMSLEPVMVFNDKKQLMINSHIPNGFYYILAQLDRRTDSLQIIDQYNGGPVGYRVYEVQMEESEVVFWTDSPINNETITIHSSQFSGIDIKGIDLLPGVFMEGVPVYCGTSPIMTIGYLSVDNQQLIFSLFYQRELLHQCTIRDLLDQYGKQISPYASELDLEKLLDQKAPPFVEKVYICINNNQGQAVFERSYCRVSGLDFTFAPTEIIVKVPVGASLKHPASRQEGATYYIPVESHPWIEVEIYFKSIGWKKFQLETPVLEYHLAHINGHTLNLPLCLLCSEAKNLKQISINWYTDSCLPEKVILFDEAEDLVSTFHIKNGRANAQLNGFYDIMQDLADCNKIQFRWEGKARSSQSFLLAEIFNKVKVLESTLYQTERDSDNLFEISFQLNFPYNGLLRIRVFESEDPDKVMADQVITTNPFYIYLNKDLSEASLLTFEIYYIESVESVFGTEEKEVICWRQEEKRMLRKAVIKKVLKHGLMLKAFSYGQERYLLKDSYCIEKITMEPKHFEEEELFKGIYRGKEVSTEVYFYLDIETKKLPFLIDPDRDGVQYHPFTGEFFWEYRIDREVMAPLDDLEYQIKEEDIL